MLFCFCVSLFALCRLVISDSVNYQQAMLTTQLNPLIVNGELRPWAVVQLKEFICSNVASRR